MGLKSWLGRRRGEDEAAAIPPAPTEQDIRASLARVDVMLRDGNAPPVVTSRVARIARTIDVTLPRLRNLGIGSADAYSVVATATDYLPEAVGGYLRLPREWADTRPIDDNSSVAGAERNRRVEVVVLADVSLQPALDAAAAAAVAPAG